VAVGEEEGPNHGIVQQGLEDDAHEARVAHVIETSQPDGPTGRMTSVGSDLAMVFGGEKLVKLSLSSPTRKTQSLEGRVID